VGLGPPIQLPTGLKESVMAKRILILVVLIVIAFSSIGCQTAKGIKEDAQFIGNKTVEILDK
jgi:predicted small secreted protein